MIGISLTSVNIQSLSAKNATKYAISEDWVNNSNENYGLLDIHKGNNSGFSDGHVENIKPAKSDYGQYKIGGASGKVKLTPGE